MDISKAFSRINWTWAIVKSIAVLSCFYAGKIFDDWFTHEPVLLGPMFSCISCIVVFQASLSDSIKQGWMRILGIFIGAVMASGYLLIFPFSITGMILSFFVLLLLSMFIGIPDNGKIAAITLIIIFVSSVMRPEVTPLMNGLYRLIEFSIGALIGILAAWILNRWNQIKASKKTIDSKNN